MKTKPIKDLTGMEFDRLRVLEMVPERSPHGKVMWLCECRCGNMVRVSGNALKKRNTRSCGCLSREVTGAINRSHGMSRRPVYITWCAMKDRCYNPRNKKYGDYGGRGIYVCDRWRDSFENFLEDMGERPFPRAELDRLDNDGPYSPDNCKWATRRENMAHTRCSPTLTARGQTKTLQQWSAESGVNAGCIMQRVRSLGWDHEKAIFTPKQR
jgi:hypothetical protein